jgi:hypothetical protein
MRRLSKYLKLSEENPPITFIYYFVILKEALSNEIPPGFTLNINAKSM